MGLFVGGVVCWVVVFFFFFLCLVDVFIVCLLVGVCIIGGVGVFVGGVVCGFVIGWVLWLVWLEEVDGLVVIVVYDFEVVEFEVVSGGWRSLFFSILKCCWKVVIFLCSSFIKLGFVGGWGWCFW